MHSMPSCLPRRGLREVTTRWRPVFPARSNTGDPFGLRGLSANEIERALISMVARSNEPLQSEAGYIDARPQTRSTKLLATHGRTIHPGHPRRSTLVRFGSEAVSSTPNNCRSHCSATNFRVVPKAAVCRLERTRSSPSFDYGISARPNLGWNSYTEVLGHFGVDREKSFLRPLDRQIRGISRL